MAEIIFGLAIGIAGIVVAGVYWYNELRN